MVCSCTPTKIYAKAKTFQSRIKPTCSWCRQLCIPVIIQTYLPQEGINRLDKTELRGWRFAKKRHKVQDMKNMTCFLMLLIYNHELLGMGEKEKKKSGKWCISFNNFKPNNEQNMRQMLSTASAMFCRPFHWFKMNSFSQAILTYLITLRKHKFLYQISFSFSLESTVAGCKESQFYSLPFGQAVASMY